jgi:magnesium transporter
MPVNIIAGIGGMSEFSMMTSGVPWPIAYGSFILVMFAIGLLTFLGLRSLENSKIRNQRQEIRKL